MYNLGSLVEMSEKDFTRIFDVNVFTAYRVKKAFLPLLGILVILLRHGAVDTGMLGVSTTALDRFCDETKLYFCNAEHSKKIVDGVEARNVKPEKASDLYC